MEFWRFLLYFLASQAIYSALFTIAYSIYYRYTLKKQQKTLENLFKNAKVITLAEEDDNVWH